ncbi:MAG: PE-PPE domain-containing protein, partial [Actinomycetia bacterium]|nr:PE-PPE domain-containing protein [Actinomycetes bacterium]
MNRATKAAMTAALPFMALPLTLAGPLPTAAAAASDTSLSSEIFPPGPATVLHSGPFSWSVQNHFDGVVCADERVCREVYYQAIQPYGPIELGLLENVNRLDFAINNTSGDKVLYGFSGGARVVSKWLQQQADSNAEPVADTEIVLVGNGGREYGGVNGFFWGDIFPFLMTPTDTDYVVTDVAREFDPIADFPDKNPLNLLALANAALAFDGVHMKSAEADLDAPGNYVWTEGNTTYVYIPTEQLPILQPLRNLGLDALADQLEAPLREIIDRAYDRDYLENATVIPELGTEDESTDSVQPANAVTTSAPGNACSGYNTEGCDIWAKQSYTPVPLPDLDNPNVLNILPNLVNAIASIPRAYLNALNDLSHSLEVTGNWWVYTPTNVLGYDPADPPKISAITNLLVPFEALSNPLGEHLSWWAKGNLPMDPGCTGTVGPACTNPDQIVSKMFLAPLWDLFSGYQFAELNNPVSDAEGAAGEEIPGEEGTPVPWSGQAVQLNPMDPVYSVLNYLLAPPEQNTPEAFTFTDVIESVMRFGDALNLAFNPFVPGSYLLKGWPYTALTPLFTPFLDVLCPQCDPDNPGDPTPFEDDNAPETADVAPEASSRSAASTVALQVASVTEVADEDSSAEVTPAEESTTEESSGEESSGEAPSGAEAPAEETTVDEEVDVVTDVDDVDTDVDSELIADEEESEALAEEALDDQDAVGDDLTDADIEDIMAEEAADEDSSVESVDESASASENATASGMDD